MSCEEEEVTWLSSFGSAEVQKVGNGFKTRLLHRPSIASYAGNSGYTDHVESEDEKRIKKMW